MIKCEKVYFFFVNSYFIVNFASQNVIIMKKQFLYQLVLRF